MKTRSLGILILITATFTLIWGVMFAIDQIASPPINSLADQIAAIESRFGFFIFNYTNAALFTLSAIAMLAGFYVYTRDENPFWAAIALVFIPVYGLSNLVAYLSQIFVIPNLLNMHHDPETMVVADILLRLTIHVWNESAVGFINSLAYAILGIPSVILGILMFRKDSNLRIGSFLLAASGLLTMTAFVGFGIGNNALAYMSPVGGFVFMIGLFSLGIKFLRKAEQ